MKARLYKLHRILSLVVFIPVILWSLSGILHPVMANWFKIRPAQRALIQTPFDKDSTRLSPQRVCEINDISSIENIGIIRLEGQEYYQIKTDGKLNYYCTQKGETLVDGDEIYAQYLARYYSGDSTSPINQIEVVSNYTGEYKIINRLLPVYKVSFDRSDGLEVYVETESGGLGTLNDNNRKSYLWLFSMFHNWDFLGSSVGLKSSAILSFSICVFITGILGLIIYWKNRKTFRLQKKQNPNLKIRRRHRKISLIASVFLLAFSFSGGLHTLMKFNKPHLNDFKLETWHSVINLNNSDLSTIIDQSGPIKKMRVVSYQDQSLYRIEDTSHRSLPKYYKVKTGEEIQNADEQYAIQRAARILDLPTGNVLETKHVTHYNHEYGFISKRLPVWGVTFESNPRIICYVETASGIPGAIIDNNDQIEGWSFGYLHKYHMLGFIGKGWRDLILSLAAFSLVLISLTGFLTWFKLRKKKNEKKL